MVSKSIAIAAALLAASAGVGGYFYFTRDNATVDTRPDAKAEASASAGEGAGGTVDGGTVGGGTVGGGTVGGGTVGGGTVGGGTVGGGTVGGGAKGGGTVTFNQHVAPIVFARCASCHRPGEAGPFDLLTFDDVRRRGKQIVEVTSRRIMPPWLPEPGNLEFVGDRRLSDHEIATFRQWVAGGMPEGAAADRPAAPTWAEGWQLGKPDLVLTLSTKYQLPADGRDVYRNFVLPVALDATKHVRGIEFRLFGSRAVHHVFVLRDRSGTARRLDAATGGTGFPGMEIGGRVDTPEGHFIDWTPGRPPALLPDGMAWRLDRGADLVLQMHLQPRGKPEPIRAEVGLHFAAEPPSKLPVKLVLQNALLDIPAGEADYTVKEEYRTPVDLDLLGVLPHTHYLGKELTGHAVLPSGEKRTLIAIRDWNFDWQQDYRLKEPLHLPRGTLLVLEYRFDNSAANPRNPNSPPQRVQFGPQSTDEMAEFWLQVMPRTARDRETLLADYNRKYRLPNMVRGYENLVGREPKNTEYLIGLAALMITQGDLNAARQLLGRALAVEPDNPRAFYYRGYSAMLRNQADEAIADFELAVSLDENYAEARNNLGYLLYTQRKYKAAAAQLERATALSPHDALAHLNLARVRIVQEDFAAARQSLLAALAADPDHAEAQTLLIKVERQK